MTDGVSPDGRAGIDNTIAGLWTEDFSRIFDTSYGRGESPIVLRLSGVDDLANDACVDLEWIEAHWAGAPRDPRTTSSGEVLRIDGGAVARLPRGRIVDGRLTVEGAAPVVLRAVYTPEDRPRALSLPMSVVRLGFVVAADQLTQGDVGGRLRPEDMQRLYRDAYGNLIAESAVASILFLDLPSGTKPCAELSAGFGFQAVGATLVP